MEKGILHIGLFKRDKEKNGGEIGITLIARHPGKQRHVSFLVCLLKNKISLASWNMKQEVKRLKEWKELKFIFNELDFIFYYL